MERKTKRSKESSFIYGRQPLLEALNQQLPIDKILLKRQLQGPIIKEILQKARQQGIPIQPVPMAKLNRMTSKNHQGLIAMRAVIPYYQLEDVLSQVYESGELPLFLLLDQVSDVRNFGAIVRSAACMGVHAVVVPSKGSASINEDAMKTSAGALTQMQVCRAETLLQAIDYLKESGLTIAATDLTASEQINKTDFNVPLAILMGAEDKGVQKTLLNKADVQIKIPMKGKFDSLNVSVATGVILYEVLRQRS